MPAPKDYILVGFFAPPSLHKRIKEYARQANVSVARLLRSSVLWVIENVPPERFREEVE